MDRSDPLAVRGGIFLERYVSDVMGPLRGADADRNGFDRKDIEAAEARARVQARAQRLQQVFSADQDGDLKVTRQELLAAGGSDRYAVERAERTLEQNDLNRNGVIEPREVHAAVDREAADRAKRRPYNDYGPIALLALDPNGDGRLTAGELRTLAEARFKRVDRDGDEWISDEEHLAERERVQASSPKPRAPAYEPQEPAGECRLPAAGADAQVVVYGTYEGADSLRGRFGARDPRSSVATVEIQPGARPLYVVLASFEPMVWTFQGRTERVAQVVMTTPTAVREGAPTGVEGVPVAKVATASHRACFRYFSKPEAIDAVLARAAVREALGREPDVVAASYKTERVILPAGRVVRSDGSVEPKSRPFSSYGLPDALEPLVASGAVQPLGDRDVKIVKPIARWPAGDHHRVARVLLGRGVPEPPGLPDHVCVFTEAGELLNPGALCRAR